MAETQYQVAPHGGRITYAKAQDLPSFPSSGLRKDGAAASAAASLGWANQKSIESWKPDKSASASAAAVLAKDYKMAPQWQPDSNSSAGAKAALLATASAKRQQEQQASLAASNLSMSRSKSGSGSFGNSAATQAAAAMRQRSLSTTSPPSQANFGSSAATSAFRTMSIKRPAQTPLQPPLNGGRREGSGSLSAAKSAMPTKRRPRATSTPLMRDSYPDEANAASNALSAATAAHGPSMSAKALVEKGGSVPYTALPRSMFTANPKIGPEADDEKRADLLHASAVAMAKKMYSQQQKMASQTKQAYGGDDRSSMEENGPRPYVNLQEAAYKMAQERLAKLEEEHKSRRFQEYYGGSNTQKRNSLQRRFTMKARLRRRSDSDDELEADDKEQSEKIRQQMSIFSNNLSKIDEQKRAKDRQAVLEAAQRNVRARLQGMDEKVYAETGKLPPPRKLSEWELKAHEAAQAMHDSRNEHKGKVNMGGGMFMSPEDVDAIAAKKVQPVLDEINEKAAIERERQEVLRAEADAKKRDEEKRKERDREIKEINKKIKDQEKAEERERKQHEKQEIKAKKDDEKAVKAEEKRHATEEKRHAKEERRKSRLAQKQAAAAAGHPTTDTANDTDSDENEPEQAMSHVHPQPLETQHHDTSPNEPKSPKEAGSPTHKVKSWLKSRFHRPRGKSGSEDRGFIGGAALSSRINDSSTSLDNRAASMREMAEAGRGRGETVESRSRASTMARDVSPLSSEGGDVNRSEVERAITPPAKIRDPNEDKGSPSRDSRFRENLE